MEEVHDFEVFEAHTVSSGRVVKFGTTIADIRAELDAISVRNKFAVATGAAAS